MYSEYTKGVFFKMLSGLIRRELNPDDFELGTPVVRSTGPKNTDIEIRPVLDSHFYFHRVMQYDRADLSGPYLVTVQRNGATDLYSLLDQINEEPLFEVNQRPAPNRDLKSIAGVITQEDVFNVELPDHAGRPSIQIAMKAKPESLFVTGALFVRILKD